MKKINKFKSAIIIAILFAFGLNFVGCEKEKDISGNTLSKSIVQNPYDFVGTYHNLLMNIVCDKFLNESAVSMDELSNYIIAESSTYICNLIPLYSYSEWSDRFYKELPILINIVDSSAHSHFLYNLKDPIYASLNLSNFQIQTIQELLDFIEDTDNLNDIPIYINHIERKIIQSSIPMEESWILLGVLSVAKHSFNFGINYFYVKKGISVSGLKKILKNIVRDDALGFVAGLIGSVISGHASVALVFGPEGAVCVMMGDAIIGAVSGSAISALVNLGIAVHR